MGIGSSTCLWWLYSASVPTRQTTGSWDLMKLSSLQQVTGVRVSCHTL